MNAALVESDRRFASTVQERVDTMAVREMEDAEIARRLAGVTENIHAPADLPGQPSHPAQDRTRYDSN
jgi:hypothetical protein